MFTPITSVLSRLLPMKVKIQSAVIITRPGAGVFCSAEQTLRIEDILFIACPDFYREALRAVLLN